MGWQLEGMDLDQLLLRLHLVRQAFKWREVPEDQLKEALEGDALKLAEVHLRPMVERRLLAARSQKTGLRRRSQAAIQKLDDALAVIATAKQCGVQLPPNGDANDKKKRMTEADNSTDGARKKRKPEKKGAEQKAQPTGGTGSKTRSHTSRKRNRT